MAETFYGCERVKKPTQFDGEAKSGPVRVRRSYNILKFRQTNEQILLTPLHFTSPASGKYKGNPIFCLATREGKIPRKGVGDVTQWRFVYWCAAGTLNSEIVYPDLDSRNIKLYPVQ